MDSFLYYFLYIEWVLIKLDFKVYSSNDVENLALVLSSAVYFLAGAS